MTLDELKSKIAEALDVSPEEINENTNQQNLPSWDSMGTISIISLLDDFCDSEITAEEAEGFTSFAAIVDYARKKSIISD